jgi:RimJ/RimL family protein N-acetyltransferase
VIGVDTHLDEHVLAVVTAPSGAVVANIGSLRVPQKAGFRRIGVNRDFAPGRGEEIEETILRLD